MNKDLYIGQRVKLSVNHRWKIKEENPTNCYGTVNGSPDDACIFGL